ncbi:MAG: Gfo/Idh/MocA family protein [Bacteroidota bacterium]
MNIGIIGCGVIAASHVRILRRLKPGVHIAVCDVDARKAEAFAAEWNITAVYTDVDSMLQRENPLAVHIVTPPHLHASLSEKAILAGAHVFVEKPITERAADYERIASLAQTHRKVLCGDYSTLGMPVVMEAVEMIRSGMFGELIAVHCNFAGSEGGGMIQYKNPDHWAYRLQGGILQNMIDHPLSLVLSVMEPIDESHVFINHRNMLPHNSPDLLNLTVKNAHQIGSLTLSLGHGCNERRAQFLLQNGTIVIDMGKQIISSTRGSGPQSFIKKALSGVAEGYAFAGGTIGNIIQGVRGKLQRDPGIVNVMQNFYDVIDNKAELLVRHETLRTMTRLLDNLWMEVDPTKQSPVAEVKR